MNLLGKLQSEYEQLWKYIIRPPRAAYSEDTLGPATFRLEGQEVQRRDFTITNSRGLTLSGSVWVPTLFDRCNCVLYLHGNAGNRTEGMEYLGKLIKHSLALCTFDFAGCGNADGEYVTLGYYEQEDLRLVVEQLRTMEGIRDLALWGRSMGAVTAMLYLAKTIEVKAAVFDSPFKCLRALVEDLARRNSKMPSFVVAGAIKIISRTIEDKAAFSIYNINPLKYSVPGLYCPAFFITALEDEIVPAEHTKQLFAAYAGEDKLLKLVKGKHNDTRPEDCVNEAVDFLLERLGHDWKEDLKKPKKEFDFFEMEKLQQQEREQHRKEEVDFFEQVKKQQAAEPQEDKKEEKEKTDFSLAGLFSLFGRDKKKDKEKSKEKEEPIRDGYEDTRAALSKKTQPDSTKQTAQHRRQRQEWEDRTRKQAQAQPSPQALPAEWVMFVI